MKNFKRILAVLLVLCMLPVIPLTAFAADGDAVTFTSLATADGANGVKLDGTTYTLTKNITVNATNAALTDVTIDGAGYTITTSVPIFADLGGTVKNLKIDGKVEDSNTKIIGVLVNQVATAQLQLTNVINNAELVSTTTIDNANVGGFIGKVTKAVTLTNCTNNNNVIANTENTSGDHRGYVGGFVGNADASTTFISCANKGEIKGNTFTGGFIGYASKPSSVSTHKFTNCANIGDISSTHTRAKNQYLTSCLAGGFVGGLHHSNFTFSGCYNLGDITASLSNADMSVYASGFFCGSNLTHIIPAISNCYSMGSQTATHNGGKTALASSIVGEYKYDSANKTWSSANNKDKYQNNVYVKDDGADPFSSGADGGFSVTLSAYKDSKGYVYTADDLANGTLKKALNNNSGSEIFFQRVNKENYPIVISAEYANTSIADYWTKDGTTYTLDATKDIIVGLTYAEKLTGTLEGRDATVYAGAPLFADVAAIIQNLTIEGSIIDSTTASGGNGVAALARIVSGATTLENVVNNAKVESKATSPNNLSVGGLIGFAKAKPTLINCHNNAEIAARGTTSGGNNGRVYVGGLIGYVEECDLKLEKCSNSGYIFSNSVSGGLIGRTKGNKIAEIISCANIGNVETKNDGTMSVDYNYCSAAGLIGNNANNILKVTDTFNVGKISATATANISYEKVGATAAGLFTMYGKEASNDFMSASGYVKGCYSLGNVVATTPDGKKAYAGLIFSDHYKKGTWTDTYLTFITGSGEETYTNYVLTTNGTTPIINAQGTTASNDNDASAEAKAIYKAVYGTTENPVNRIKTVDDALAFIMTSDVSIRLYSADETGIRFNSSVNKDAITAIQNAFGNTYNENYEIGTMLWVTGNATASEFTHAAFKTAGDDIVEATRKEQFNDKELNGDATKYVIRGSIIDIAAANSNVDVSARAYIKLGNVYIYADGVSTASVVDVANVALYDTDAGYSASQIEWMNGYLAASEEVQA